MKLQTTDAMIAHLTISEQPFSRATLSLLECLWRGALWRFGILGLAFLMGTMVVRAASVPIGNGERVIATLALNTTNAYAFSASAGDYIQFRAGAPFRPLVVIYGPSGAAVESGSGSGSSSLDGLAQFAVTTPGEYRVEVSSYYRNATGQYQLSYARSTGSFVVSAGDEGGALVNNTGSAGVMDRGDMDLWSFQAAAGETVLLRMGSPEYRPYFQVFGPSGKLLGVAQGSGSSTRDAFISIQATNSGTFLVVAQGFYPNSSGAYVLSFVKAPGELTVPPGDEGGVMTNGYLHSGQIALGDLDGWTFNAVVGQSIHVRMGAPQFRPLVSVYGPQGVLVGSNAGAGSSDRDAVVTLVATNAGIYTVVATSFYDNGAGPYILTVAQSGSGFETAAGDEGGGLINGAVTRGSIPAGDIDIWTFPANKGESMVLRVGSPEFRPWLSLFGPDGRLVVADVGRSSSDRDLSLFQVATNSGTYTLWVESFYTTGSGDYALHLAKLPGTVTTSVGDEGGRLVDGEIREGVLPVGDQDVWQFVVCQDEEVVVRCEKTGGAVFTPRLRLFDRAGVLLNTATQPTNVVSFRPKQAGVYAVIVDGAGINQTGSYRMIAKGVADGTGLCAPAVTGTNAVVQAVGGTSGEGFVLLTHTEVSAPLNQWTPVQTNVFDEYGVFRYSQPFTAMEPKRFFFLRLESNAHR